MARKPSKKVQENRERALALELDGFDSSEISQMMGERPATVRKWLRQIRGPARRKKDTVLELTEDGMAAREIKRLTGISASHISRTITDRFGPRRRNVSTSERIGIFRENPDFSAKYTWTESFSRGLLKHSIRLCEDGDLSEGNVVADLAIDLFESHLRRTKVRDRDRRCMLTLAINVRSFASRLGGHLSDARALLRRSLRNHKDCFGCLAEIERNLGYLCEHERATAEKAGDMQAAKHSADASEQHFCNALSLYESFPNHGHSLENNGIASTLHGRSGLFYYTRRTESGLTDSKRALSCLVPRESPGLVVPIVHLLALHLLATNDDLAICESARLINNLLSMMNNDKTTIRYAKVLWADGLLQCRIGSSRGLWSLMDAREIFELREYSRETVAITSDILTAIEGERDQQLRVIEDLCSHSSDSGRLTVPAWLKADFTHLLGLVTAIRKGGLSRQLLLRAREGVGGNSLMPALLSL